ncbi:hypothetical protein RvY_09940 [Ramazzottius varieornatus]|uniref:Citrate transporter-like domain-containing protein n=1 Tax=Ramazzottius varieornatus TaxID=947166 RepID=A0A1D1VFK7_RAMVA|nr:hypothetical protein RvY_09940 [Ramazzottius varieornatus]
MKVRLGSYWKPITAVSIVIFLLPLCFEFKQDTTAARCGYVLIIMALYWVLELIPIPITGLLPAFMFPLLGIQKAKDVSKNYFQDSVMLFMGGLLVALAVEHTNLHRRIALKVLLVVGSKPHWIMAGFMVLSAGLSMFISNTATTAMVLPIAIAVIVELGRQKMALSPRKSFSPVMVQAEPDVTGLSSPWAEGSEPKELVALRDIPNSSAVNISDARKKAEVMELQIEFNFAALPPRQQEIAKALVLCVAYASSIGGMATLTGTLTNTVFSGQFDLLYPNAGVVTYATFFFFAFPTMAICLIFAWCWLGFQFFLLPYLRTGISESDPRLEANMKRMFRVKHEELGPLRFAEGSALAIFLSLVLLWFFREPKFMPGWNTWFKEAYISDTTPGVLMGFLLSLWPVYNPFRRSLGGHYPSYEPILNWKVMATKFPWDVLLLLGGALALADGVQESGLTEVIKRALDSLNQFPPAAVAAVIALIVTFSTEFASNAAMASIFLPVVATLAETANVNPLYYMLPVTMSCSFAFMFPVATPPNAIAFGCGFLKVADMNKCGFALNIGCMLLSLGALHTFGFWVFHLDTFPGWANNTVPAPTTSQPCLPVQKYCLH